MLRPAALSNIAVGSGQRERLDARAESAVAVVVLAVDVGGDHAADRDEARAGHGMRQPAARHESAQDVAKQHAGFAGEQARLFVECEQPIHWQHGQREGWIERRVAVGAPVATRDQRLAGVDEPRRVFALPQMFEAALL